MDVQTALRWLNACALLGVSRAEPRESNDVWPRDAFTELFFSAQNKKEGSPPGVYVHKNTPGGRSLLAAGKTLARSSQVSGPKSSTAAVCVWAQD